MKFILIIAIIILSLFLYVNQAYNLENKSSFTLIGIVLEYVTNRPVSNAMILIKIDGRNRIIFTKDNGSFQIGGLQNSIMKIEIYAVGYETYKSSIELNNETTRKTFTIKKPGEKYLPIIVIGSKIWREIAKQTVTKNEIKMIPGVRNDPVKATINTMSGISLQSNPGFNATQFIVRGGEPTDNLVLYDNILALYPFHQGALQSVFHSESIERIDFYSGAYPVGYGSYYGSVMDIKTTRKAKNSFVNNIDINTMMGSYFLETPVSDELYVMLGARRSYLEAFADSMPYKFSIVPYFYDYLLKLSWDPNKKHNFDLLFFGAFDEIKMTEAPEEHKDDPEFSSGMGMKQSFYSQGINWKWNINKDFSSLFTLGLAYRLFDEEYGLSQQTGNPLKYYMAYYLWEIREEFKLNISKDTDISFGLFSIINQVKYDLSIYDLLQEGEEKPVATIAEEGTVYTRDGSFIVPHYDVFFGISTKVDNWKLTGGFDWNYDSYIKDGNLGPKGSVKYDFSKKFSTTFATGIYYQFPEMTEYIEPWGTTNLEAQKSYHFTLNFNIIPYKLWEIKLEPYLKYYDNLVVRNPDSSNEAQPLKNLGSGKAYGVEFNIKKDLEDGIYLWLNYTLAWSFRKDNDTASERYSQYDQRHLVNLVGSYQPWKHWKFAAKWRFSSGKPMTAIIGRGTNNNVDYYPIYGNQLSVRNPSWHQLDVRASYMFNIIGKNDANIYLEIQNIYNQQNVLEYYYKRDYSNYNNPSKSYDNPLTPAFGLEWTF